MYTIDENADNLESTELPLQLSYWLLLSEFLNLHMI